MSFPLWTRWAIGLSLLVLVSARMRLPMPTRMLDELLVEHAPDFTFDHGRQWLRWGDGEVVIEDVVIGYRGERRVTAARLEIDLNLWPWSPDFLMPTRVELHQPDADVDQEFVRELIAAIQRMIPRDRPMRTPPAMRVRVRDLAVRVVEGEDRRWSCTGVQVEGRFDTSLGGQVLVTGDALAPFPGTLVVIVACGPAFERWQADARVDVRTQQAWPSMSAPGLTWSGGPLTAEASIVVGRDGIEELQTRIDARLASVSSADYGVEARDLVVHAEGDLRHGLRFEAEVDEAHGRVRLQGDARPPLASPGFDPPAVLDLDAFADWSLHAIASADDVRANQESVQWLRSMAPELIDIADALDALGIEGTGSLRTGIHRNPTDGWNWALHVLPGEIEMSYRGFVEPDGRRIAVPYPVDEVRGAFAVGGKTLLWTGRGRAGVGTLTSDGSIDFRDPVDPRLRVDLVVEGLELDRQAAHALSGNPDFASRWREFGSPLGGTLDLDLRIRDGSSGMGARVAGRIRGASGEPRVLPVRTEIEDASFLWTPGLAEFRGRLQALGSSLQVVGEVREQSGGVQSLSLTATGTGFRPSPQERLALQGYLGLPEEIADVDLSGDLRYELALRMPDVLGDPQVLLGLELGGASCNERALEFDVEDLRGAGTLASGRGGTAVFLPDTTMEIPGGQAWGAVVLHPDPARRAATLYTGAIELDEERTDRLRNLVGLELWDGVIGISGTVSMRGTADPGLPETFRGVLHCEPVLISAIDDETRETYSLEGDFRLRSERVVAERVHLSGTGTDLWVRDFDLQRAAGSGAVLLDATLDSASGVRLSSNLPLLLGPDALRQLRAIGLDGVALPRRLAVKLRSSALASELSLTGTVDLTELSMTVGPGLGDGRARLLIEEASWFGFDDYRGQVRVVDAQGTVSGMLFSNGTGTLTMDPRAMRLVRFRAEMLGGRVVSEFDDGEGNPRNGEIALGLTADGPVHVELGFRDLGLDRMREELKLGGSLSGTLDADIDLAGTAASSTGYRGRGRASIRDGVLGTVPVLKNVWAVAGVRPPVFQSGELSFRADGIDRVIIDDLVLNHPLMDVRGKGYIRLDTELHLKVSVRTLGPFGGLPILSHILDLFVEQDVRGSIERPRIQNRATNKLFNLESHVPFPLWVPAPPRTDWRRSPIVPVVPAATPDGDARP